MTAWPGRWPRSPRPSRARCHRRPARAPRRRARPAPCGSRRSAARATPARHRGRRRAWTSRCPGRPPTTTSCTRASSRWRWHWTRNPRASVVVVDAALQAGDLGPHQRPVGDVVVLERPWVGLGRVLPVPVEERQRQIEAAEALEVHGQEADVVQHVAPAEPIVELEPVEDAGTVVEAEDVLRQQVAVPIDDAAPGDALLEQPRSVRPDSDGRALRSGRRSSRRADRGRTVRSRAGSGPTGRCNASGLATEAISSLVVEPRVALRHESVRPSGGNQRPRGAAARASPADGRPACAASAPRGPQLGPRRRRSPRHRGRCQG